MLHTHYPNGLPRPALLSVGPEVSVLHCLAHGLNFEVDTTVLTQTADPVMCGLCWAEVRP